MEEKEILKIIEEFQEMAKNIKHSNFEVEYAIKYGIGLCIERIQSKKKGGDRR